MKLTVEQTCQKIPYFEGATGPTLRSKNQRKFLHMSKETSSDVFR